MGNSLTNSQSLGDSRPTLQQSFGEFYNSRKNELKLVVCFTFYCDSREHNVINQNYWKDVSNADLILHSLSADHALKKLKLKVIVAGDLGIISLILGIFLKEIVINSRQAAALKKALSQNLTLYAMYLQVGDPLYTTLLLHYSQLQNCSISPKGGKDIAHSLTMNHTLKKLDLQVH